MAFTAGRETVRFSLDIAPAYPPEAKVARWRREVTLDRRKREVVLAEDYALGEAREPVRLHFMTPLAPDVTTPGRVVLARPGSASVSAGGEAGYALVYDGGRFTASVEEKAVTDARLQPVWGGRLFRIVLTARDRVRTRLAPDRRPGGALTGPPSVIPTSFGSPGEEGSTVALSGREAHRPVLRSTEGDSLGGGRLVPERVSTGSPQRLRRTRARLPWRSIG